MEPIEGIGNLEKKKIYEKQAWTNKPKDEQAQGRTDFGMTKVMCIIAPVECYKGYRGIIFNKKEYSDNRCPNPVYFYVPLLIISERYRNFSLSYRN